MKVFVYGTLKKGFGNHRCLDGAVFLGEAVTSENYLMHDSGFPALRPSDKGLGVLGEVYEFEDMKILERLDRLEGHPHLFERTDTVVVMTDEGEEADVQVYIGNENFSRRPVFEPKDGFYVYPETRK